MDFAFRGHRLQLVASGGFVPGSAETWANASVLGIRLFPNLRLRNATDGVIPLAAGYECASLCSCTRLKQPANYHWRSDVAENVDYGTLADAIRLTEATVRRLDERWI